MTEQNGTFKWNKARNDAALLVAEDDLTDIAIAEKVGIGRTTLFTWKQHAEFRARVKENIADLEAAVLKFAIAKKRNRVSRQNADWMRLQQIRKERAEDPTMCDVPGGGTGLIMRQLKVVGLGINSHTIEEWVVDTGLVKAQSELEKQAASEVGDDPLVKVRHSGDPEHPIAPRIYTIQIDRREEDEIDFGEEPEKVDAAREIE